TLSVSTFPSSAYFGESVTFTFSISSAGDTPTGTVTVDLSGLPPQNLPLDASGQASLTTSELNAGLNTLAWSYSGDGNYYSTSGPGQNYLVNPVSTTTTV